MENMNKCPGCSQHCDRNNLQCGKGEAYFNGESVPSHKHEHCEEKHHEGKHHEGKRCGGNHCEGKRHEGKHCGGQRHGHGHHRPEFPAGSLADLMAKCGHRLFHGGNESLFNALSAEEQSALKNLLSKLLSI